MIQGNSLNSVQPYSDPEVIQDVLLGNTALFEILIRRYNSVLYKTGRGYGFNHHDTEDLMQETFINAYLSLSKFENRASFKTWLVKIMLNQCYHKSHKHSYKKEQSIEGLVNNNSERMFVKTNHSDTAKSIINKELNKIIEAFIDKLPEDYRMTFTLRELTGLSVAETAELMQTTTANVKVRLSRAKMMLQKEIEKVYSPEDIYEFNLLYCDKIVDAVMKEILK